MVSIALVILILISMLASTARTQRYSVIRSWLPSGSTLGCDSRALRHLRVPVFIRDQGRHSYTDPAVRPIDHRCRRRPVSPWVVRVIPVDPKGLMRGIIGGRREVGC